jgi:hypothetical protein
MEKDAREGNEAGVMGHAMAGAVPAVAPMVAEGAIRGVGAAAPPMIRDAVKGTNAVLEHGKGVIPAAAGSAIGHATGIPGGGMIGGAAGYALGKSLPKITIPGENFGIAKPSFPGAPLPAAAPELIRARPIGQGGAPAPEPAAGLGKIPIKEAPPEAPAPALAKPDISPKAIEGKINDGLGGTPSPPVRPGVKIGDQRKPQPIGGAGAPEGLTPVQSNALKSYKYDPATREFTAGTQTGAMHIHGDVSPEQVAKFEASPSKGKAWNELRANSTPVAKVVNGKRVSTIPPRSLQSASPDDLTGILQGSVKRAKASAK